MGLVARLLIVIGLFGAVAIATPVRALEPICSNPATIFCEDWETTTLPGRWADGYRSNTQQIVTTEHYSGSRALQVTLPPGDAGGGWLTSWLTPTGAVPSGPFQGYAHTFVRYYWKHAANWQCMNGLCGKMIALYGLQTGTSGPFNPWSGFGQANVCPNGTDYFYAGVASVEPPTRDYILYTYYPDMPCVGGASYGQYFHANAPVPLDQWNCVEQEVLLNTPGQRDGLQRLWVNGTLVVEVLGMRWRDTTNVQSGALQLTFSVANPLSVPLNYWADNIVVSTQRIGCGSGTSAVPSNPTNVQLN
jgi:hypothetical protein